jgi:hypothetical protein
MIVVGIMTMIVDMMTTEIIAMIIATVAVKEIPIVAEDG